MRGLRPCDPAENQGQNLSEKENPEAAYALPLVGIEQDASGQAKTKLARTGTGAVKQLHVLAAASLAGFEVITDGRFCGDHRGLPAREAVGHFDERVRDGHIHFVEQSLGWMRISIPQIKRLTVDGERKESPVVVETFAGKVYRGICPEQLNLGGVMVSFDKVKNLVLEAFDREAPLES